MIESGPLISVIVPNYHHSKFLNLRLETIFEQSYQNFELIILDDCSPDESREILSKYSDHPKVSHCIFNEENSGNTFAQWNKGIKLAKGDYIWIAESDDYSDRKFLEKLIEVHLANREIALAFCQSHRVNSGGEITGNWITYTSEFNKNPFTGDFVMDGNDFIEKYLIHKNVIPNVSGVLFKSIDLHAISPLVIKPFLKYNADWFYYIQLLCNSNVAFVSESLNFFRFHEKSVIARAGNESGRLKIFKMQLAGRKEMFNYLEQCKPSNLNAIRQQSEIGNLKLKNLIAKSFFDRRDLHKAIWITFKKRLLFQTILFYFVKKRIRSSRNGCR